MDPRQQAQEYSGGNTQRVNYGYSNNGIQNDPFNAFVNTDNESAFEPSWNSQSTQPQQQSISGFDQSTPGWQQTPYQSSNYLGAANFGSQREYEQFFNDRPSSFSYPSFDPSHNQTFASNSYGNSPDASDLYKQFHNGAQFEYHGPADFEQQQQQHGETISPQALQTYPSVFPQQVSDDSRAVSHSQVGV